ncbi:MAG: UbiX family flavin prenyltransferase [Saprospiraceae bacterium]
MKIVVAISGSSGSIYAKLLLDKLSQISSIQCAIVMSENARINLQLELPGFIIEDYGIKIFSISDFKAPFASGSAKWDGMIVCPCSAGFLSKVASGLAEDLMSRAAQVMLKERKKLVLVLRETPFSLIHIENMKTVSLSGGIICPAIPSFYSGAKGIEPILSTVTDRAIELLGIESNSFQWGSHQL